MTRKQANSKAEIRMLVSKEKRSGDKNEYECAHVRLKMKTEFVFVIILRSNNYEIIQP